MVMTKLALDLAKAYFGFVSNSIKVIESIMAHEGSQSSMLLFLKLKSQSAVAKSKVSAAHVQNEIKKTHTKEIKRSKSSVH